MISLRITAMLALLGLAACAGTNGNGIGLPGNGFPGGNTFVQCNPGTQVQLARPAPNQTGTGSINAIEIVANGSNNILNQSPGSWQLQVTDNLGNQYLSGPLSTISDTGGPHPYSSDFFYNAPIQSLPAGYTYNVSMIQANAGCSAFPLSPYGTFST
ncbi:MAG: hypothetical protein ABR584_10445 [Candidatus Baltobacteraceae bacterium]